MEKTLEKAAADKLAELLKETGHRLKISDYDAIRELNEIARRIARPDEVEEWDYMSLPVWYRAWTMLSASQVKQPKDRK